MSTELEKQSNQAPAKKAPLTMGAMGLQLNTIEEVHRAATILVEAGFAPKGMDTAVKASAAILKGMEIGLPAVYSLQNIAVINGRPSMYGDAGLALVRGSGMLAYHDEGIDETDPKNLVAWCEMARRGENKRRFEFSQNDAIRAKLWMRKGASGADTPWVTYPKRMLMWRARWFAMRDIFPDALCGICGREESEYIETEAEVVETTINPKPSTTEAYKAAMAAKNAEAEAEPPADELFPGATSADGARYGEEG